MISGLHMLGSHHHPHAQQKFAVVSHLQSLSSTFEMGGSSYEVLIEVK